jgi:predicted small metal-binding protein
MPTTPNNPSTLKPFDDEILDVKKQSLYARLKRLFSTDVIVRNVGGKQLKIKDTDSIMYATDRNSLRDRYNRIRSTAYNAYTRDFALSYQAARMDLFRDYDCVGPDTIIPLPDGSRPTIAELAEKYKNRPQERFLVFSYDHETNSVKLGKAYHPRKKDGGTRKAWKVIFDNGQHVVGSAGHPFLMRNGEYKKLEDLTVGESVMPFYQKDFYNNGYRSIYNFSKGWQSEHVIVAEQFVRSLKSSEVVHHKDFNKTNNLPSNLQIMSEADHKAFHMHLNNAIIWSPENKQKTIEKVQSSEGYKNRKCHKWNGERVGKNNPFYGKYHSKESNTLRSKSLKTVFETRNQLGSNNPNYCELTYNELQNVCKSYYLMFGNLSVHRIAKFMHYDYSTVQRRIKEQGMDWRTFKQNTIASINHKITAIEYVGEMEVYDVTVEKYKNFATDSCFVHNTMDMDPILSSALDIYADECLTYNEVGKMITVHSNNNNVKRILENLFDEILNVRFNLWSWTRNMCKYGDFYLKLYITPEYGIYMVEPISAYNVERIENSDPSNKRYVKFQLRPTDTSQAEILENYEVAHFRLISDSNFLPYGKSMIEGARRVWKQLSLMEDAMLISRIMRAPERRIFYTDIGNIPPNEVDAYMQKMMDKMKKVPYIDEQTGEYNLRFNLQNMIEDYYIPVRGGDSGTKIDTLAGMEWTGIDDLEYIKTKMMAALKIPKAFLGYEEGISGKATLASEDVRFARTIQRLQRIIASELSKIAIVHLYAQGYRDESLVDFEIELTNPSTIFEQEKVEIWQDKISVAIDMVENKFFSYAWVYKNIFNMSEDDIKEVKEQVVDDAKQKYRLTKIEEDGDDPAKPFKKIGKGKGEDDDDEGGLGDLDIGGGHGGGGGGGSLPDLDDLGDEEGPEGDKDKEGEEGEEDKDEEIPDLKKIKESTEEPRVDDRDRSDRDQSDRDQEGEKKTPAIPEDPIGKLARTETPKKKSEGKPVSAISHNYEGGSPLRIKEVHKEKPVMDKGMIGGLAEFLTKTHGDTKKELLAEAQITGSKSMLDPSNILE